MRESAGPSRYAPTRRLATLGLVFVAAILSCGKDVTGPLSSAVRYARGLAFNPVFPPSFQVAGGSGLVQISKVHIVLHHSDGSIALDTTIDYPSDQSDLTVTLTVKLLNDAPASGEPMNLDLGYLNANGDVVFSGGPVPVTAAPPIVPGKPNAPVEVPVAYTGPGSNAKAVVISPRSATVTGSGPFNFTAVATDASGATIPGTPISWSSLDPTLASITSPIAGVGAGLGVRGVAHIQAQLLTGASDQVTVTIVLPATQIISQVTNALSGTAGTTLAQPLVVKVAASDGVGVAGTTVNFAVATGGGSVTNASVVSDANGLAQTSWKLGTTAGAQSVTATAGTLTNSPITFTATAQPATASKLVVTTQPVNAVAGATLAAVVVTAEDNNGNVATGFTGPVALAFGNNTTGATLGGTVSLNAEAGVATFSTLTVNKNGSAYTLVATASGLTSATTNAFDVVVGPPSKLVFTVQPSGAAANIATVPAIVVTAQDAQGNTTPSFTGQVTLALATNPTGSTISGTTQANAVLGVATFPGLFVALAGNGYVLSASATGVTNAISQPFNISGGVATNISVSSGGGQTGTISSALGQPVVIKVADAGGNGVVGSTVTFAVTGGGGSVSPASGVSNGSGLVQTTWTLGATLGAQTMTATSTGLTGSPLTITATGTVLGANKVWTGATNNQWATATNWSPAGVPAATDSVLIPVTANNPQLAASATVRGLTINAGATLTLAGGAVQLTDNGAFDATGGILGTGSVVMSAAVGRPIRGTVTAATVTMQSTYSLNGTFIVTGNLIVNSGGTLNVNANALTVNGNFSTAGTGIIQMGSAADGLAVNGNVSFGGGSESGQLTNGLISVTGNFTQSNTATSFAAGALHQVAFIGTSAQTITMSNPGSSPFGKLTSGNTAGVTLASNVMTLGNVALTGPMTGGSFGLTIGGTLTDAAAGLAVAAISFQTSTAPIASTTAVINSNVTFNNNPSILAGNVTINGGVNVSSGNLQINGHHLVVNGPFTTVTGGQLTMTNPADSVYVSGTATFGGGVEAGILTTGKLVLAGNFVQNTGTGAGQEFKAVAGHQTILTGSAAQTIGFANPDTTMAGACSLSCFGDFTVSKTGGSVVYSTIADHRGKLRVLAGFDSIASVNTVAVHDSLVVANGQWVHFARLNSSGNFALDTLNSEIDTASFFGTSSQVIGGAWNGVVIRGTPTVDPAGFNAYGDLVVGNGGTFTMGGTQVSAYANFATSGTGLLVMNNAADSLFVMGQATFNGGAESGKLTNGTLVLFQGIVVSAAGQFSASGSHVTYLVGPPGYCDCLDRIPARHGLIGPAQSRAGGHAGAMTKAALAARRAAAALAMKDARSQSAAQLAARKAHAAKFTSRADAVRQAAAAGRFTRGLSAPGTRTGPVKKLSPAGRANARLMIAGGPKIGGGSGHLRSASVIPVQSYSDSAVYVAFSDTTGNQFGNVRIVGGAQWQTFTRAAGNVQVDTTGDIEGSGHLSIGGDLVGAYNSTVEPEAIELFGVMSDTGYFSPDTTLFSGTSQVIPSYVGSTTPSYYNVVVNGPSVAVLAEDENTININGSLFIQNSGQLRIGQPDPNCNSCYSDDVYVWGALETHGSGKLQMTDANSPYMYVSGNSWFDGGSTAALLTQGEIDFYGNFSQTGSTTSYSADSPHESYFSTAGSTIHFANPGAALSHFGDLYFGATQVILQSSVWANGQLETGSVTSHQILGSSAGFSLTSGGADIRHATFDAVTWTLLDGYAVTDMDSVIFTNQTPTATQFTVQRNGAGSMADLTYWTFQTMPTGGGRYINALDTDGASNGVLTLNMLNTTPGSSTGLVTLGGGALITGWSNSITATWTGGGTTSAWNTAANWDIGVPTSTNDVVINSGIYQPTTGGAVTVHNLTVNSGATLTVSGANMTVNGDISVAAGGKIDLNTSNVGVNAFGNVATDTAGTTGITTCAGPTSASLNLQAGTHSVTGKFCNLSVFGNYTASGPIAVTGSGTTGGLNVSNAGANLTLGGNHVIADHFSTASSGTLTMTNANDSLTVATSATFAGGATTGLLTAGNLVVAGPTFSATGQAFDASGTHTTTFNGLVGSVTTQTVGFGSAVPGHGFQNLIFRNSSHRNFSGDQWIMGTLTFDASNTGVGTDGSYSIHVANQVDNSAIYGGSWNGSTSLHMTGNGTFNRDTLRVNTVSFDGGGSFILSHNLITSYVVVDSGSSLIFNGHRVDTGSGGNSFTTQHGGVIAMNTTGDSLIANSLYFNGGNTSGFLTKGGINVTGPISGTFFQGYDAAHTAVPSASVTAFAATGTRVWFNPSFGATVAFANPASGGSGSHFGFVQATNGNPVTVRSDVFVDSLLLGEVSGDTWQSDSAAQNIARTITTRGIYNAGTYPLALKAVSIVLNDGPATSSFSSVTWTNFPTIGNGGALFTQNRTSSPPSINFQTYTGTSFTGTGAFALNLGTSNLTFGASITPVSSTCISATLTIGLTCK